MSTYLPTIIIYIGAIVLMVTYDHGPATKNRGLSGNIVISLLVAAVILYGAAGVGGFDAPVIWWIFGVVFLTNLAREMVKDCMDMESDAGSRNTLPMKYGKEKVRNGSLCGHHGRSCVPLHPVLERALSVWSTGHSTAGHFDVDHPQWAAVPGQRCAGRRAHPPRYADGIAELCFGQRSLISQGP